MADLSNIYDAFTAALNQVFYAGATPTPGQVSTVTGSVVRIYPGWPAADQLNIDLAAGVVTVSIFAPPGAYRNTTRYPLNWVTKTAPVTTVTATVDETGTEVTIGGTVSIPQNIAVLVDGHFAKYAVQIGDTLNSIATAVAAAVNAFEPAYAVGPVVHIDGARELSARVGGAGVSFKEVMRIERRFQVTFWCPTPALRTAAAKAATLYLAQQNFLTLADGMGSRLITVGEHESDEQQKPLLYRRDVIYSVEYPVTDEETDTQITVGVVSMSGGIDPSAPPIVTQPM